MMMAARTFSYGGVPVYNPQSLSKTEALAQFHARQAAYKSLLDLLREESPSHVLVIGTRGMGKTTLLQRIHYGVEDDAELNKRYLVLAFPEEQYNVNRLHHFLLNTVDALADAMEKARDQRMLTRVEAYAEMAGKLAPEEIEERVPQFLAEIGKEMHTGFLLLVDNADRLFDTIQEREQWQLRELLANRTDLTLFGATTQASEGIYGPKRAFFEFFKIETLTPLTVEEVRDLLLQLGESIEEAESEKGAAKRRVQEWLETDPGRLRTLVQLTGGNPRTTVLLFHLVLDGLSGGAREYLEQLLDQSTPNYKGRVDELPPQAQQVLDAVALRWDPVTAMDIASDTGLETSAVSTQLTRLVRQGVLEKADPGDSKKALYQVAERFFNIWYLMRASRRVRAKLRWFVEFLRVFFDSAELKDRVWKHLDAFRRGGPTSLAEIENAVVWAVAADNDVGELQKIQDYLRQECADRRAEWSPHLDVILKSKADTLQTKASSFETSIRQRLEAEPKDAEAWITLGFLILASQELSEATGRPVAARGRFEEGEAAIRNGIALLPAGALTRADTFSQWFFSQAEFYAPLASILARLCALILEQTPANSFARLHRAVALAQMDDFPHASVALGEALLGDPIELLETGKEALEVFFAAAVRNKRVRDCIELLDKRDWKDAWRPIYEALKAVEAGSGEYLKRVAVEIREPAAIFLRRISPALANIPER